MVAVRLPEVDLVEVGLSGEAGVPVGVGEGDVAAGAVYVVGSG